MTELIKEQDRVCGWSNQRDWVEYGLVKLLNMNRVYGRYFITPMSANNDGLLGESQNFKHLAVRLDQFFGKPGRKPPCSALFFCSTLLRTGQSAQYN